MTDKPIIFSAPMVQALLDGRKTQDRRVLSLRGYKGFHQFGVSDTAGYDWTFRRADWVWEDLTHERLMQLLPYAIGDRLWVRESVSACYFGENYVHYWADNAKILASDHEKWDALDQYAYMRNPDNQSEWGARVPSIHMPRWASRLTLTVTDVRVQRLQDITEADAAAEGVSPHAEGWAVGGKFWGPTPQAAFRFLWEGINGPESWDANPWIVALTFTMQHGNIDKI